MLPHGVEATDWLELPEPLLHPDAPQLVAAKCGESAAVLRALLDREVFWDPRDERSFVMWPWYPEQDQEMRAGAQRRANELGAGMPAWLDDPYEAAFYLQFTGEPAFVALAETLGVPRDQLYLERVPRVEPAEIFVDFEGGQRATHPWVQRFELVERALGDLDWMTGEQRPFGIARVRNALSAYIDALGGFEPPTHRPVIPLDASLHAEELEEPGELHFERVFCVDGGALLQVSGWLVRVGRDEIRVLARVPGEVRFASRNLAVIEGWGIGAFDLERGEFRDEELDPIQEFGGPLVPGFESPYEPHETLGERPLSPDARYVWDGDRIVRLQDGLFVSEFDVFGDPWEAASGPPLVAFEDLSTAGQRQTVLDGVTFTHRAPMGFRVRDAAGFAFALHGDHWRAYLGGRLMRNDVTVAQIGVTSHEAAFSKDAETLFVLTDTDLLEISWHDEPVVAHTIPLYRIAGAIEDHDE